MNSLLCVTLVVVLQLVIKSNCLENNVCPTFQDYYTIKTNPNCWYDFAADSNVVEIITKSGYPVERHKAITADGYILTMFRIPNYGAYTLTKKEPVLLQHGWLNSAAVFIAQGKDSLAFQLSDAGYDVWLGNFRGSQYSEKHINLTIFDEQYWDYSADELGLYDIPAQLELIAKETNQRGNTIFIGHSLGTTAALIYGSSFPQLAKENVKLFILLAPSADIFHTKASFFKGFGQYFGLVLRSAVDNGFIKMLSHVASLKTSSQLTCLQSPASMQLCMNTINYFLTGPQTQTDPHLIPVLFNQMPAGISFKVTKQISDFSRNGFKRYDHGRKKNMKMYRSIFPPPYNVSKIEVPIFMMYAINDWICTTEDSLILYNQLSPKARFGIHKISEPNFNHLDFAFGRNAKKLVADPILEVLQQFV